MSELDSTLHKTDHRDIVYTQEQHLRNRFYYDMLRLVKTPLNDAVGPTPFVRPLRGLRDVTTPWEQQRGERVLRNLRDRVGYAHHLTR